MESTKTADESTGPGRSKLRRVMRRIAKWTAWLVAIAFVLVLVISAIAYALLDEALLKRELSRALGREMTFARLSPGLLKISVDQLGVGDLPGFAADPLFEAARVDLMYSLLSIFKGRLVINRAVVSSGRLGLERHADGASNFSDLAAKDKDGSLLEIRTLELDNLDIAVLLDSGLIELKGVTGEISDLSMIPNRFELRGEVFGGQFKTAGWIDPDSYTGRVKLILDRLPMDRFGVKVDAVDLSGLSAAVDGELGLSTETYAWAGRISITGLADIDGHVAGALADPLTSRGEITVTAQAENLARIKPMRTYLADYRVRGGLRVMAALTGDSAAFPASISGELLGLGVTPPQIGRELTGITGKFRVSPAEAHLDGIQFRAGGTPIAVSGRIGLAKLTLDLAVNISSADAADLIALAPKTSVPKGLTAAGPLSLDARITGTLVAPRIDGLVILEGMTIGLAEPKTELSNVHGRLELAGDDVKLADVTARMKSMSVAVSGTYHQRSESVDLKIKADNIVLAELPADLGSRTLDVKGAASFDGAVTGKASSPVIRGDVRSERLELYGVTVSNILAAVTFDSPSLNVSRLRAGLMGGEITGDAGMNIFSSSRPFQLSLAGRALDFPQVIALGTRLAGSSFSGLTGGKTSGRIDLSATNFDDKTSMSGTGDAEASDVDLGSVNVIVALSQALMAGQLKSFAGVMNALTNTSMKRYESIRGSFRIEHGRLIINQTIRLAGADDYSIGFRGGVGLDGGIDGLFADVEVPRTWFGGQGLRIAQLLTGATAAGNKVTLPFAFSGSFSAPAPKPVFKLNPQSLLRMGLEVLDEKVEIKPDETDSAPEVLEVSADPAAATETAAPAPPRNSRQRAVDILGDLLRGH